MRKIFDSKIYYSIILLLGLILIAYSVYIYLNSPHLTYWANPSTSDIIEYSSIRILIGIAYTAAVVLIIRKKMFSRCNLFFMFLVGLIARVVLIPTEPILEDDYNRYLWDGAVTANGFNPYEYPPKLFQADTSDSAGPDKLHELADSSGVIIERINHPHIRTIYPPVSQLFFSAAYYLSPWNTATWKLILLLSDLLVFILLYYFLRRIEYSPLFIVIYWWNPILLHEMFNAGHMDIIMYPLILGGIVLLERKNSIASVSAFALAAGVKIWPLIFIPFVLKKITRNKKILAASSIAASIIIILILLPILITKLDNSLGFITYTKNWTNNESIFQLINLISKQIISILEIKYHCSLCIARWTVFIFYLIFWLLMLKSYDGSIKHLFIIFYYLAAVIFFISPTQFPWYYTWILPFLVFKPRLSIIAYTILLPLYQLKYSHPSLVWIEHLPIFILFVAEIRNRKLREYLS